MIELESPLREQVEELREKSVQLAIAGNEAERAKVLLQAWELFPEPKGHWGESYHIATYLINSNLKLGKLDEAKKWSEILFSCSPNRPDAGVREFWAGVVDFELGNFEEAKKNFAIADKESKGRNFKKADSKYLKFYKQK